MSMGRSGNRYDRMECRCGDLMIDMTVCNVDVVISQLGWSFLTALLLNNLAFHFDIFPKVRWQASTRAWHDSFFGDDAICKRFTGNLSFGALFKSITRFVGKRMDMLQNSARACFVTKKRVVPVSRRGLAPKVSSLSSRPGT